MSWADAIWKALLASPTPFRIDNAELTHPATGERVAATVMNTAAVKALLCPGS